MNNIKTERPTYVAGDILYKGSQLLRDAEAKTLRDNGIPVYMPHEDKEINDKANQDLDSNAQLAEKIVFKDTLAIKKADKVIIEPQRFAEGTLVELGQIKAYNEMRKCVEDILNEGINNDSKIDKLKCLINEQIPHKEVYAHLEDIRRTNIPEVGDRRSFYVNQYVLGVVNELTNGRGFMDFKDIVEELKIKFKK